MKSEYSYVQSHRSFEEDRDKHERSHFIATKTIQDLLARGVCLEDLVRHSLPRLGTRRLERIMTLLRNILASKYETQARYAQ